MGIPNYGALGPGYGRRYHDRSLEVDAKNEYFKAGGGTQSRIKSEVRRIAVEALCKRGYSIHESENMLDKLEGK